MASSFKHISSVQWVSLLTDPSKHVLAAVTEIESLQKQRECILALPVPNRPCDITNVQWEGFLHGWKAYAETARDVGQD